MLGIVVLKVKTLVCCTNPSRLAKIGQISGISGSSSERYTIISLAPCKKRQDIFNIINTECFVFIT